MKKGAVSTFRLDRLLVWQAPADTFFHFAVQWWLSELAGFVPLGLRRRVARTRTRLLLVADTNGVHLATEIDGRRGPLGHVDLATAHAATVRRFLAASRGGLSAVTSAVVSIAATRALRTTATLPLAAERNLDQVVGFEFDRLVPFKRDDVYYTHRVVERRRSARNLQVGLTVVPRADVADVLSLADRIGLRVEGLEVAPTDATQPSTFIPLQGKIRTASRPFLRKASFGLAAVTGLLAAACIVVPFIRGAETADALAAEIATARSQARASMALQQQIDAARRDSEFLIARKRKMPTVTELLDILTRLTPDNTYLTEMQIGGGEIHIVGVAASATSLLGLIDQSQNFRDAAFRSSITQDPTAGGEHFDISARIVPREGK